MRLVAEIAGETLPEGQRVQWIRLITALGVEPARIGPDFEVWQDDAGGLELHLHELAVPAGKLVVAIPAGHPLLPIALPPA